MAISEATIKNVRFPPELIPDSWFGNVPLGAEVTTPVLDLRRFEPYITELSNIRATPNANVVLRARYDDIRVEENTAAMLADLAGAPLVGAWNLVARKVLYLNFFGVAAVANYIMHYGVWAYKPTIAHKLLYGITLTNDEKLLADKYGIRDSVEKGVLPLPISSQIEREYHVLGEETHSRSINIAVANTPYTIESIYPRKGEIVVLTRMAANPGGVANVIRFIADRDDDIGHADVRTFPLSLVAGGEVACFIPAIREIRLHAEAAAGVPVTNLFRYTYQRIKLTNTLRARFGLASKDELPGDTYEKVLCGVL